MARSQVWFLNNQANCLSLGLAPIPVPGYGSPADSPTLPGVNTIPGLSNFNYIVRLKQNVISTLVGVLGRTVDPSNDSSHKHFAW